MNPDNSPPDNLLRLPSIADETLSDTPRVIMFPPLLLLGTLVLGLLLHYFWPIHPIKTIAPRIAAAIFAVSSISMLRWGLATMKRAGTPVRPNQPTLTIVTSGPFRFTRNPLYVSNSLTYLATGLVLNNAWLFILFLPMMLVLHWGVVLREERYLAAKFGKSYLDYKAQVPRWL